jgi:hypothetical protein
MPPKINPLNTRSTVSIEVIIMAKVPIFGAGLRMLSRGHKIAKCRLEEANGRRAGEFVLRMGRTEDATLIRH